MELICCNSFLFNLFCILDKTNYIALPCDGRFNVYPSKPLLTLCVVFPPKLIQQEPRLVPSKDLLISIDVHKLLSIQCSLHFSNVIFLGPINSFSGLESMSHEVQSFFQISNDSKMILASITEKQIELIELEKRLTF